ncbi:MAG: hypothetical protein ACK5LM_04565 [Lactovum sp.]
MKSNSSTGEYYFLSDYYNVPDDLYSLGVLNVDKILFNIELR